MDSQPRTGSIAAALERQRIEYRVARLDRAIGSLVERRDAMRGEETTAPAGLLAALADFRAERGKLQHRLTALNDASEPGLGALGTT
jgi:hypothetical protein